MNVVRATEQRVTTTPNGRMTTVASPTLGAAGSSVWMVEMHPGAEGPEHAFDSELVWTILDGSGTVRSGDTETEVSAGDTLVMPADELRRLVGGPKGFRAIVAGGPATAVTRAGATEKEVPGWVV